jgi:hypothetical protein
LSENDLDAIKARKTKNSKIFLYKKNELFTENVLLPIRIVIYQKMTMMVGFANSHSESIDNIRDKAVFGFANL